MKEGKVTSFQACLLSYQRSSGGNRWLLDLVSRHWHELYADGLIHKVRPRSATSAHNRFQGNRSNFGGVPNLGVHIAEHKSAIIAYRIFAQELFTLAKPVR